MNERGEKQFSHLPKFAAKLYDKLMKNKPIELQISEIANDIISNCNSGSILDVGTGHGRLLKKLHELAPNLELYGLDISHAMIKLAKNNLKSYNIDLQVSNILKTPYNDENFDIVTCTGSFYLWNKPIESVNEIFRILKPEN
ncbi:MAG: class I SAM-dependent methyltransferase [Candidatus Lokiarchaeota archaeon]